MMEGGELILWGLAGAFLAAAGFQYFIEKAKEKKQDAQKRLEELTDFPSGAFIQPEGFTGI
jgi:hypothetical protein